MSLTIDVARECGDICITPIDGVRIYDRIFPIMRDGGHVTLDFAGVRVVAAPFLVEGVGRLLQNIPRWYIADHLAVIGLDEHDRQLFDRVVENAYEYYSDPVRRRAIDHAIEAAHRRMETG